MHMTEIRNSIHLTPNLSLSSDATLGVGHLDTESLGLGEDVDALAGRDGVADSVSLVC